MKQVKKTAIESNYKSKTTIKQKVKGKRGPKVGERIKGIPKNRKKLEKVLLEMFLEGDMEVDPQCGTATLCRFIAELKILYSQNGKPLSVNTIKEDFTEIKKENLYKIVDKRQSKNSNIK